MKSIKNVLCCGLLLLATVMGGSSLASCSSNDDKTPPPAQQEVTIEDALKDGNLVVFTFNLDGVDYDVTFRCKGDIYELVDVVETRAEVDKQSFRCVMEYDKAADQLKVYVREMDNENLVLTIVIDVKEKTLEVIPGNSQIKVTSVKVKVQDVEVTDQLKDKTGEVTLADALVKDAKVVITYNSTVPSTTVFTFVNNGSDAFGCSIEGKDADDFKYGSSMRLIDKTLVFSASHLYDQSCDLKIHFSTERNTYKFMTVTHDYYKSFRISVNDTDITSKLKEER